MIATNLDAQNKTYFLSLLPSEIEESVKLKIWSQFYSGIIIPIIDEISNSINKKSPLAVGQQLYRNIKAFRINHSDGQLTVFNIMHKYVSNNEIVQPFLFFKISEKLSINNKDDQFKKNAEIKIYTEQSLVNLALLLSTVNKLDTSFKDSFNRLAESILDDIFIKSSHYTTLNNLENELFREKIFHDLTNEINPKLNTISETENRLTTIQSTIETKLNSFIQIVNKDNEYFDYKLQLVNKKTIDRLTTENQVLEKRKKKIRNFSLIVSGLTLIIPLMAGWFFFTKTLFEILSIEILVLLFGNTLIAIYMSKKFKKINFNKQIIEYLSEQSIDTNDHLTINKINPIEISDTIEE